MFGLVHFFIGLFLGSIFGVIITSCCVAASRVNEDFIKYDDFSS